MWCRIRGEESISPSTLFLPVEHLPVNEKCSALSFLLAARDDVPSIILPQLDDLILFIIDKMSTENIEFIGCELCMACWFRDAPLSSLIVRALLETEKFDPHAGYKNGMSPPLFRLIGSLTCGDIIPSSVLDCIYLLLNTKGFDVNRRFATRTDDYDDDSDICEQAHILERVAHPEIAKILLRHGVNLNGFSEYSSGICENVLHFTLQKPYNPHLEELVRLYISHGVLLLADGKDKKIFVYHVHNFERNRKSKN